MKIHFRSVVLLAFVATFLSAAGSIARAQSEQSTQVIGATYIAKSYLEVHARGLVRTNEGERFLTSESRLSFNRLTEAVPSHYSMRGIAGPVEDQGNCGSCWDFSLTSTLRGTLIMLASDPGRLSFNYLLNCATAMQACDGGDFPAAKLLTAPAGAPAYGSDGPYVAAKGNCKSETPIAAALDYHLLGEGSANPSFKDLALVMGVLHRPVTIDIVADSAFESYSGGVFNGCSNYTADKINHMVTLEGYDCESSIDENGNCVFDEKGNLPPGVGTWLIRNSWNATWGDQGYITMKATDSNGQRCNQAAYDALYFDLKIKSK